MPIIFRCEHCQRRMSISRKKAGQDITCPHCESSTRVPEQEPGEAVAEQPPPTPASSPEATASEESFIPAVGLAGPDREDGSEEDDEFVLRPLAGDEEPMDLTPMVDVTFLLLIFFMVTASFSIEKSFEVPVPEPDQEGAAQTVQEFEELEDQSILVEIDSQNRFFVEAEPVADPRDLPARLADVRTRESKSDVMISVDQLSHHEAIVAAIDAAQEVGMQRIRWGVAPEE